MPTISSTSGLSPFQQFKLRWSRCGKCDLREGRTKVVLCRGTVPARVLFVGEAPGLSEDVIGQPFIGPAGHLLDRMIREGFSRSNFRNDQDPTLCFTNLVCCIPKDGGRKVHEPPKESIEACAPRLKQFIRLVNPEVIIAVGSLAANRLTATMLEGREFARITHPAAVLRAPIEKKGLMYQTNVVELTDVFEELT